MAQGRLLKVAQGRLCSSFADETTAPRAASSGHGGFLIGNATHCFCKRQGILLLALGNLGVFQLTAVAVGRMATMGMRKRHRSIEVGINNLQLNVITWVPGK